MERVAQLKKKLYLCANKKENNTTLKNSKIMTTLENVQELAVRFLTVAGENKEGISNYFNGSNRPEDTLAYIKGRVADKFFINALNDLTGERYEYGLNYELANWILN